MLSVWVGCTGRGSSTSADRVHLRLGFVGPNLPGVGVQAVVSLLSGSNLLFREPSMRTPAWAVIDRADVSDDGLRYTLHLRSNLETHDGQVLSSSALQGLFADLRERPLSFPHSQIERVSSPSEQTLEVRLAAASPLFLESLVDVTPPVNASRAGAFVPISTGDDSVSFRAFDRFVLDPPTVETLEVKVFPTWRTAWGAMLRGEVDGLWEAPTDAIDFLEAASEFRIYSTVRRYAYLVGFNLRTPRLRDARVRRAFGHAVDRDRFVAVALRGHGEVTSTQLNPLHWSSDASVEPLPFDRPRARALLLAASPRVRRIDADERAVLSLECLVPADDRFERVAQELQRQSATVGIELRLVPLPLRTLIERLGRGEFETYILEAAGQSPLLLERFWASYDTPILNTGYTAADPALLALRAARSDANVRAAVARVQEVLRDDPPAVFLAYPKVARVLHRRFHVPAIPEESSLVSQRVLPFVTLARDGGASAP